jgi:predicted DNA-binding transcriptional regulator AlpA
MTRHITDLPELSSRPELYEFTGISVQTFARWAMTGEGPRITKLGHTVRYRKADVIAWLEKSAAVTTTN